MPLPQPVPQTADGKQFPLNLKLAFSKAADISAIDRMFAPDVKKQADPGNYVVKRERAIFEETLSRGSGAFLQDPATGQAYTLTMAYHVRDKSPQQNHIHTEIGTSLTILPGFKSAPLVIAALVLKEWWNNEPSGLTVSEIMATNNPSLHVYRDMMGWQRINDPAKVEELEQVCNEYIAPEDKGRQAQWFSRGQAALPILAKILLDYMDRGTLTSKFTAHEIGLDLSALAQSGLTRSRLEKIAAGVTDKAQLTASVENDNPEPRI